MKRILIIEDDRDLNQGLCLALQNSAHQIVSCFDLQSGRRVLAEQTVDLILLDINLPDGNGLTFLQELRKGSAVPVILLTARHPRWMWSRVGAWC